MSADNEQSVEAAAADSSEASAARAEGSAAGVEAAADTGSSGEPSSGEVSGGLGEATAVEPVRAPAAEEQPAPEEADDGAVLDATGRERPRFLLAFPEHPDLQRLAAAFEAGNYALVRKQAEALAERTDDVRVRDAALELRRRIDPDPLAKYLLALTAALLLSLAYFAYHH